MANDKFTTKAPKVISKSMKAGGIKITKSNKDWRGGKKNTLN